MFTLLVGARLSLAWCLAASWILYGGQRHSCLFKDEGLSNLGCDALFRSYVGPILEPFLAVEAQRLATLSLVLRPCLATLWLPWKQIRQR